MPPFASGFRFLETPETGETVHTSGVIGNISNVVSYIIRLDICATIRLPCSSGRKGCLFRFEIMKHEGTVSIFGETSESHEDFPVRTGSGSDRVPLTSAAVRAGSGSDQVPTTPTNLATAKLFRLKPASEWIESAKTKPAPRQLFGEFWSEGEFAILFADTGMGKSVLAVQLAELIARGPAGGVFPTTSKPQRVLYLDFELTEKQFELRYCDELGE